MKEGDEWEMSFVPTSFYALSDGRAQKYRKVKKRPIGEGAYGYVYKGEEIATGLSVAMKKVKLKNIEEGIDRTTLREIKLQVELNHPNITRLFDVFIKSSSLHLVFEYCFIDLRKVIENQKALTFPNIKAYMKMILLATKECHDNNIIHRDIKPENLLIAEDGNIKLSDFGLARLLPEHDQDLTPTACTRWYRAPEMLFGANKYTTSADMWSVGCVFAELMLKRPFLAGHSEIDQITNIFHAFGTPEEEDWPRMSELPNFIQFNKWPRTPLRKLFSAAPDLAIDLLAKFFLYDPLKRISADEALQHPFFGPGIQETNVDELKKNHIIVAEKTGAKKTSEKGGGIDFGDEGIEQEDEGMYGDSDIYGQDSTMKRKRKRKVRR